MSQASNAPSGRPGRYNRSFEGLIGAMVVMVLVVVGFVVYRGLFTDPQERRLDDVDYLDAVLGLQQAGFDVVYPADLPDGWQATGVLGARDDRVYGLNFYTGEDRFVGLVQADDDVDDLLEAAGVENAEEADALTGVNDVAPSWQGWADGGDDDHAFSAELPGGDGMTVVVYGSAPVDELADLVGRLTTAALATTPATTQTSPTSPTTSG